MTEQQIKNALVHLFKNKTLAESIFRSGVVASFSRGDIVAKYDSLLSCFLMLLDGSVNFYVKQDGKEILAYSLKNETLCLSSFEFGLQKRPSPFQIISNLDCVLFRIPIDKMTEFLNAYPEFMIPLFSEYAKCQNVLVESYKTLAFSNLESRLRVFLEDDANRNKTHQELANDLGTAREVVTRLVKKIYASN